MSSQSKVRLSSGSLVITKPTNFILLDGKMISHTVKQFMFLGIYSEEPTVSWKKHWKKYGWMSQTENIKGDKIKALALAKECYAMKLELLTNATIVDDAIRFVVWHAAPIEKAITGKMVMHEGNHDHEKQQSIKTTNTVF